MSHSTFALRYNIQINQFPLAQSFDLPIGILGFIHYPAKR